MSNDYEEQQVSDVALSFFEGIKSDLLASGGIFETRAKPLRRSHVFASAVFDEVAVILATQYHQGTLDFEIADWLANTLEGELTDLLLSVWPKEDTTTYPRLWSEVYDAFDAGEFDHFGRSSDPVAEFTNPMIAEFVTKHGQKTGP